MRALILATAAGVALAPAAAVAQQSQDAGKSEIQPDTRQQTQASPDGTIGRDENLKPDGAGLTWQADPSDLGNDQSAEASKDGEATVKPLRQSGELWEDRRDRQLSGAEAGSGSDQQAEASGQSGQSGAMGQTGKDGQKAQRQDTQSGQKNRQAAQQQGQQGQQGQGAGMMAELRPTTVTCRELTNYDTAFVPGMVYWIDGYVMARNARGQAAVEPVVRMRQDWFAVPSDRIMQACADQPDQPAAVVISRQREQMMNQGDQSAEVPNGPGPNPREALSEQSGGDTGADGGNGSQ